MREMIKQVMCLMESTYARPCCDLLAFSWQGMDAGGFGFAYKGGARIFSIRFESPVDLDRVASGLVSVWGNVIGEYLTTPERQGGYIVAYWSETKEPVLIEIDRQRITIMVNRDQSDLPVYSFLENLRRYIDPCATLEKI